MDAIRTIELTRMNELNILQNVRLLYRQDLNPVTSNDNLRVQFNLDGEVKGAIICHLCLDNKELSTSEKNFLFPLFVESMNILIGRQISLDEKLNGLKITISPPKLNMISMILNTANRSMTQKYELEINDINYIVLNEYSIEILN
jgi:hypothetical protein